MRKKKRPVPEHSSVEEEREDWKEKNRQKKKNLSIKKQEQPQRSESATSKDSGQDRVSSSRDSSLSSRHSSSVDRLLEHQQQHLQQQQQQMLEGEHCHKGSHLIIEKSPVHEQIAEMGRKMSAAPAPLSAPVPSPANRLPSCKLRVETVKTVLKAAATLAMPEHLSLEDGEIHGTDDAVDNVNVVEDIGLDNTESSKAAGVGREQFYEQKQKKVRHYKTQNSVYIYYFSHFQSDQKNVWFLERESDTNFRLKVFFMNHELLSPVPPSI